MSPNAETFKPQTTVILPIKLPEDYDLEQEKIGNILTDALTTSEIYGRVIDPAIARNQLAEKGNKVLADAVSTYLSKLMLTGISDPEIIKVISKEYHCDTIIVTEMSRYGYITFGGQNYGEVGFSIKVIDSETGLIYWKAGHTAQEPYVFIKPDLGEMTRRLMKRVLSFAPNAPKNRYPGYPTPGK